MAASAGAAQKPHVGAATERAGRRRVGVLTIHRRVAVRILTANGKMSAPERAQTAAERLSAALDDDLAPSAISAKPSGGRWRVMAGDSVLLQVPRAEAKAHGASPAALARTWAAEIRRLLAMPPVSLGTASMVVPFGEARAITVGGWAESGLSSSVPYGSSVASADLKGRKLIVRGLSVGRAQVQVEIEGRPARCSIEVKKYAAWLGAPVTAEVTGAPSPSSFAAGAAVLAVRRTLPHEQGAVIRILRTPAARPISAGGSETVSVAVAVSGGGHIPVSGTARVSVRNTRLPARPAGQLLYSNSPERISKTGLLFSAPVEGEAPARIFYHHINDTRRPLALAVTLVNPLPEAIKLQIVPGFGTPDADAVRAGHKAGRSFFPRLLSNAGEIYTLPAGTAVPLALHRLTPQHTASGMAELRLLAPTGAKVLVRVTAIEPGASGFPRDAMDAPDAWRRAMPRIASLDELKEPKDEAEVYPKPVKQVRADYTIGQPWTWVKLGREPIPDADGSRRLDGNYGVRYKIDVTVHNPTAAARTVEVVFEPGAGIASGVFTVCGRYVEAPITYPSQERPLAHLTVGANETRTIPIETVPLGGSAYPASLIIR